MCVLDVLGCGSFVAGPSSLGGGGGSNRVRSKSTSATAFSVKGAKGPFARWLDLLSPSVKFAVLVGCVMVSFCLHNMLQVGKGGCLVWGPRAAGTGAGAGA